MSPRLALLIGALTSASVSLAAEPDADAGVADASPPPPPALPPSPPALGLGPQGFFLGTVGSGFQLRLRGVVQADGRAYLDEPSPQPVDTFLIRRARPIIEGTVADLVDFRLL